MLKKIVEKKTFDYFESGYCCSEAICKAITEQFGNPTEDITKMTSAFCGGIGGSKAELCGALTGGLISIGWLLGRSSPNQDNQTTKELAITFQKEFEKRFNSVNCGELLDGFGNQENNIKCKEMTARTAGLLFDLLQPVI